MFTLKKMFPEGGEVIVPPLTWVSDITSVVLAGFEPIFCDIDENTLGMKDEEIIKKLSIVQERYLLLTCKDLML